MPFYVYFEKKVETYQDALYLLYSKDRQCACNFRANFLTATAYIGPEAGEAAQLQPDNLYDKDAKLVYISGDNPIVDIKGQVPQPGYYVLVANYYQPDTSSELLRIY